MRPPDAPRNAEEAGVTDWMTIRVVMVAGRGEPLAEPPGRTFVVHADHSFADLAEAIDTAFARWDLAHLHEFAVEGRRLMPGGDDDDEETEDSDQVTVGEVGLREGALFTYTFDLGDQWEHDCSVEEVGIDPYELAGDEPEVPVPVFGWGTIPDQYGRITDQDPAAQVDEDAGVLEDDLGEDEGEIELDELDDDDLDLDIDDEGDDEEGDLDDEELDDEVVDLDDDDLLPSSDVDLTAFFDGELTEEELEQVAEEWDRAEAETWGIVAQAIAGIARAKPEDALLEVTSMLRATRSNDEWPFDVLWAAAELDDGDLPDDDEQLWLQLAAGVIDSRGDVPLEPDVEAAWLALELADWAGAVIGLVRAGRGASATPADIVGLVSECPEIEGSIDEDDAEIAELGFSTVAELWQGLGILDADYRLTPLGVWGLPESLRLAWSAVST